MHPLIQELKQNFTASGDLKEDALAFLKLRQFPKTAVHCMRVGDKAKEIAEAYGIDPQAAEQAGWLHDISAVIPNAERLAAAQVFGLEILPEEESFPMILHQKLSVVLAREIFGVNHESILSAV